MATNGNAESPDKAQRSAAGRGPSYPALNVSDAIERARAFYAAERRSAAPIGAAAKHWGYSEASSSTRVVAAALLQYGLLEDAGSREHRTLKLTDRGLDILLDAEDSPKRLEAIRDAVRAPKANADVFARYEPHELPSDQTLRYFLLRDKGFNDGAVDGYIKTLRESIAFSKLDKTTEKPVETVTEEDYNPGIMSEAAAPASTKSSAGPAAPFFAPQAAMPSHGEREWVRGSLSKDPGNGFRIIVSGDIGPKAVGKLIKFLQAQKAILEDDDDDAPSVETDA